MDKFVTVFWEEVSLWELVTEVCLGSCVLVLDLILSVSCCLGVSSCPSAVPIHHAVSVLEPASSGLNPPFPLSCGC